MATVDATWGWTADALGMTDAGNSAQITWTVWLSSDGSPANGCVQVTAGAKSINSFEDAVQPVSGYTWEVLGVPAGATVTAMQVLSWNYKKAAATNLTSHSITMTFIASDGTPVTTTPSVNAVSLGTGTSAWGAGSAGTTEAVLASYQASNTDTRLRLRYNLVTPSTGSTPSIDTRFDTVVVRITYTPAGSVTAAPGAVAGTGGVPAAGPLLTTPPAAVAGTGGVSAATPRVILAPAATAGTGDLPAVALQVGSTLKPAAVAGTGGVPAAAVVLTTAPAAAAGTGDLPVPTPILTIAPAATVGTGGLPTVGISAGSTLAVAAVAGTGGLPAVLASSGSTLLVAALSGTGMLPDVAVVIEGTVLDVTATPEALAGTLDLPAGAAILDALALPEALAGEGLLPDVTAVLPILVAADALAIEGLLPDVGVELAGTPGALAGTGGLGDALVVLANPPQVAGLTIDRHGAILPGARVVLFAAATDTKVGETVSGPDGRYVILADPDVPYYAVAFLAATETSPELCGVTVDTIEAA